MKWRGRQGLVCSKVIRKEGNKMKEENKKIFAKEPLHNRAGNSDVDKIKR